MNIIASKLNIEYKDFLSAKEMAMTIDLGENMREQFNSVFRILEKNEVRL